jgi:hypothetical protein
MINIALIAPVGSGHYATNTLLDGLFALTKEGKVSFKISPNYPAPYDTKEVSVPEDVFIEFAQSADLIFLSYGKRNNEAMELARKIDCWKKTIFIDGSEVGGDRRYDPSITEQIANGSYTENGAIHQKMLTECPLYFRREKPYIEGIIPLPFGIESRYIQYNEAIKKDIDFVCVFGQEEYPKLRREVRLALEEYCKKEGLVCVTKKTEGFSFDDNSKRAGRDEYYNVLARAKVGISVGGGGYDTARFWEILANNCLLLTETIDIYPPDSKALAYERICQFKDLIDFKSQLEQVTEFLRHGYVQASLLPEYLKIIEEHSTKRRVEIILEKAREKKLITQ